MENLTAEQVNQLADNFMQMANALGNYRYTNIDSLTDEENQKIKQIHNDQLSQTTELYTKSAILVLDDAQNVLDQINGITSETEELYNSLASVQKIFERASSILNLSSAIISLDVKSVTGHIQEMVS